MPAKVAAILNMKGGVGKTTLSFNLALYLAELEHQKVLLVDLDPQANATVVCTDPEAYKKHTKTKKTIADVFVQAFRPYGPVKVPKAALPDLNDYLFKVYENPGKGRLDLVPSELMLSSVLRGMSLGPYDLEKLITAGVRNRYDYILIDCAPTYSVLTTIALNTTKAVLIPMISDSFGRFGVQLMKQILEEHEHDFGFKPKVIGVVFTMWKELENQRQASTEIVKEWGGATFDTKISSNEWYKVSNGQRTTIWHSKAHQKIKVEFDEFVKEFKKNL